MTLKNLSFAPSQQLQQVAGVADFWWHLRSNATFCSSYPKAPARHPALREARAVARLQYAEDVGGDAMKCVHAQVGAHAMASAWKLPLYL